MQSLTRIRQGAATPAKMRAETGLAWTLPRVTQDTVFTLLLSINCPKVKQPAISSSDLGKSLLCKWAWGFVGPLRLSQALVRLRRLTV